MTYRYSRWDGSQRLDGLDAEDLMEALSDDLLADGDIRRALQRLMRSGWQGPDGQRLDGLQQLLERLRAQRRQQLDRYNLNSVMEDIAQRLQRIVETERGGIDRRVEQAQSADPSLKEMLERIAQRKRETLDHLPESPAGQIQALREYEFMDDDARRQFQELLDSLQQQVLQSTFRGMQQQIQQMRPEDLQRLREMVRELNQLLAEKARGGQPDATEFLQKYGDFFPGAQNLDDIVEQLRRQMAQLQSLLDSMTPEMRRQLQGAIDALLQDDRLRWDLAQLAALMQQISPRNPHQRAYPFQGDESISLEEAMRLMDYLQRLDQSERQLKQAQDRGTLDQIDQEQLAEMLGDDALQALEQLQQITRLLEEAGYVEKRGNRYELTPRGIRRIGQKALQDIFARLRRDRAGRHETNYRGTAGERTDQSKPYEFGDPFLLDLRSTLMNGVQRNGPGTPVQLRPEDFDVYRTEHLTQCSTVLMLDMSRSMLLRGLYLSAKKVALALNSLIRTQYPKDDLYVLGFAHLAHEIPPNTLPLADWNEEVYGTNMEHGFMLARQLLARHKGSNRQIIMITDGEPTAHLEHGRVIFSYPPTRQTIDATLREVMRCTRDNIVINTFMLDETPYLTHFVDLMTRINKGRAFYSQPERLGEYVLVDYVASKRRRVR
ncbi:MAG: VWA domain-containing protein [Chloroflexi bacterium]|nr:VWA domain-containing protein [Chloroflexota bacterium]